MKWKNQFITIEIVKKDVKDVMARSRRPKTLNNVSTTLAENFVCVPQSLKTRLQKKTKTSLKTQKRTYNHFTPILNHACARNYQTLD